MITAQKESLTDVLDELKPLLPLHYEELALDKDNVPLDPQYDDYLARDAAGQVLFITLRDNGELVGYFIGFVASGLHYKTCLTCIQDIFYLRKDKRGARGGVKLFSEVKRECVRRGVKRLIANTKCHNSAAALLKYMGGRHIEEIYSFWLGGD